ncbi:MAG: hypothetical protein IJH50_04970 [Kiritimatiellae bacterium]|nr:hypothetical protein [Kiritimatiellia bacterium]
MNNKEENAMNDERITLVIGCGGSGLKTILGMNRLLANNPHLRHSLHKRVYYFAVDTDATDLSDFERDIKKQMLTATSPMIESLLLSENVNILSDVVNPYFIEPYKVDEDNVGLARLKKHWWFDCYERPFRAPLVSNLVLGASQCPPASYCLAWEKMHEIESSIRSIITRILNKGNGNPNVLSSLDIFLVAGLAGGTGRGTWWPIAFKTRQFIQDKYKKAINPTVLLFDANCFTNVMEEYPDQELGIKINSLTGLSELSCWTRVGRDGETADVYVYELPDLANPAREKSDVIKVSLELNPQQPICRAYLVCGDSPSRSLGKNGYYHEMAGAWMASVVANSEIATELINSARSYNGLASVSFEVDAVKLQNYFEHVACAIVAKNLINNDDDVSSSVEEFFKKVPIDIPVRGYEDVRPNENGTLMQRASAYLLQRYSGALKKLATSLGSMNGAAAERVVRPMLDASKNELSMVNEAVLEAIGSENAFYEILESTIKSVYRGDKEKGEKPSLGRVKQFINGIRSRLEAVSKLRAKIMQLKNPQGLDDDPRAATLAHVNVRSKKTLLEKAQSAIPGKKVPYFTVTEVRDLIKVDNGSFDGLVPQGIVSTKYPAMIDAFRKAFSRIYDRINSLKASLECFDEICDLSADMFTEGVKNAASFSTLFSTPDNLEDALPDSSDRERFYKRILKPICKDEDEVKGLVGNACKPGDGVEKFLFKAIADGGQLSTIASVNEIDYDARDEFLRDLMGAIRADVYLPEGFMSENFSFKKVLERNRPFWNDWLKALKGNSAKYNRVCDAFERYLGFRPIGLLPPADEIMKRTALSMVGSTTPWWLVGRVGTGDEKLTVKVFFPENKDAIPHFPGLSEAFGKKLKYVNVRVYGRDECDGSEFCLITFSRASIPSLKEYDLLRGRNLLDEVRSFDYYNEPDVAEWLRWAEQKDGKSIFVDVNDNKGVGYPSPIYVRDEKLRAIRWRPWAKADEDAESDDAADALVYALLGNGIAADARAETEKILRSIKWQLMPIVAGARQSYVYARKTYVWSDRKRCAVDDPTCPWLPGKKICTSVCNLYSFLQGHGKTMTGAKGKVNPRDISAGLDLCARLLEEKKLFEEKVKTEHAALVKELYDALASWTVEQRDASDEEDRATWEALIARFK